MRCEVNKKESEFNMPSPITNKNCTTQLHLSLLKFNLLVFGSGNLEKSRTS